jgi:hypothetical protein
MHIAPDFEGSQPGHYALAPTAGSGTPNSNLWCRQFELVTVSVGYWYQCTITKKRIPDVTTASSCSSQKQQVTAGCSALLKSLNSVARVHHGACVHKVKECVNKRK